MIASKIEVSDCRWLLAFLGSMWRRARALNQILHLFLKTSSVEAVSTNCRCGTGKLALNQHTSCRHIKIAFGKIQCEHKAKENLCDSLQESHPST